MGLIWVGIGIIYQGVELVRFYFGTFLNIMGNKDQVKIAKNQYEIYI